MRKAIIPAMLVFLIAMSGFVYADMSNVSNGGDYEVSIRLDEGWNIVAGTLPIEGILPDSQIQLEDIGAMWVLFSFPRKIY
jgi:hypothetical protein